MGKSRETRAFFILQCGEWGSVEFHSRIGVSAVNAMAGWLDN